MCYVYKVKLIMEDELINEIRAIKDRLASKYN
jgi:hypothetical protein